MRGPKLWNSFRSFDILLNYHYSHIQVKINQDISKSKFPSLSFSIVFIHRYIKCFPIPRQENDWPNVNTFLFCFYSKQVLLKIILDWKIQYRSKRIRMRIKNWRKAYPSKATPVSFCLGQGREDRTTYSRNLLTLYKIGPKRRVWEMTRRKFLTPTFENRPGSSIFWPFFQIES